MYSQPRVINILGVTGSIGQGAADVILSAPGQFAVGVVTARSRAKELAESARRLGARKAVLADPLSLPELESRLAGTGIVCAAGEDALKDAAAEKADLTLAAVVGMAGLVPIMQAIQGSRVVAIANKEPLVAAGPLVIAQARVHDTTLLPVDSEHNAIFQVMDTANRSAVRRVILTASGGPFRDWSTAQMAAATPAQAISHPNWSMGPKISVDSATMMNKALEVIEAHYLFSLPPERIEVLVHPQSIVHSMVEYVDGSVLAQLGASDMRTPIAHALAWPARMETPGQTLDLAAMGRLDFHTPDTGRFPALALAYEVLRRGPYACVALNAANEVAVDAFLSRRIGFLDIMACIDHILACTEPETLNTLDQVMAYDVAIRRRAQIWINDFLKEERVNTR